MFKNQCFFTGTHNRGDIRNRRTEARVRRAPVRGVHCGVPSFFRAACYRAAQGGSSSYASAGWHLANSVGSQIPDDVDLNDWIDEIEILQGLAAEDDRRAIWNWFAAHYPKAMTLVPARRRDQFAAGVQQAWEDDRIIA